MKGRTARAAGGKNEPMKGTNEAAEDLKSKPERYNNSKVENEAEERKRGGRTKKNVGGPAGAAPAANAGRAARKSGGRAGSDSNPFTSARHGTPPKGHKTPGSVEG
jgi:hypothetical protein